MARDMNSSLHRRLVSVFPPELRIPFELHDICSNLDDEEALECTVSFSGKQWTDLTAWSWRNHGSVNFLKPPVLIYFMPSLLFWARVDLQMVVLAFDAMLSRFLSGAECEIGRGISGDDKEVWTSLGRSKSLFLLDYLCLFPEDVAANFAVDEMLYRLATVLEIKMNC